MVRDAAAAERDASTQDRATRRQEAHESGGGARLPTLRGWRGVGCVQHRRTAALVESRAGSRADRAPHGVRRSLIHAATHPVKGSAPFVWNGALRTQPEPRRRWTDARSRARESAHAAVFARCRAGRAQDAHGAISGTAAAPDAGWESVTPSRA